MLPGVVILESGIGLVTRGGGGLSPKKEGPLGCRAEGFFVRGPRPGWTLLLGDTVTQLSVTVG